MDDPISVARSNRKPWIPLLVTLLLLASLGALVGWQWWTLSAGNEEAQQERFDLAVDGIEQSVRDRMRAYEMVLRGMSGLLAGSSEVSDDEWQRATEQLQLQERYPGIQALSWGRYLHGATLAPFLQRTQSEGRDYFQVYPPGARDEYLVVDFVHPLNWRNRRVLGFDMYSENTRREAITRARDSGEAALTGPLKLKQETEEDVQSGVLLYLPVYSQNVPLSSVEERQAALLGMVSGSFRMADLMHGILGSSSDLFWIELADTQRGAHLLHEVDGQAVESRLQATRTLNIYGREWLLKVGSTRHYEQTLRNNSLTVGLSTGLLAALLLSLLVGGYMFLRDRATAESDRQARGLREREERFRMVVEASPNAIVLVDSAGLIAMVNRQTEMMFGYPREELLQKPVEILLPQAIRAAHVSTREHYQQNPEPRRMGGNRELFGQHRDGRSIPLEVGLSPLRSGNDVLVQAVIIDISARKAAEERFRLVVEASRNAIVLADSQGLVNMVNRQTEQMFGYSRDELLGHPVERLLPEALRGLHSGLRQVFTEDPSPRRMGNNRELFGQHRDGRLIPLEVGLSPLRSGDDMLVQAVIIDISERKAAEKRLREQAEQLALANRYKSEFLANMSHELRTPLNSILILSEQLKQNAAGNLTEKQVKHADIVYRAGNDLLQLINDVLDLAKIEAGRVQLKLEPLNVHDMLVELDASLRPMAEVKGLQLISHVEPGVPRVINSDRGRLHQILRNLLSNALKFTEVGEVELIITTSPTPLNDERETLQIIVRDTGIGIAPEQHERIFQAFQQIDGSTSRRFGGTGLGLAITRQLVEVLGGQISLQSAPGQGSRFIVQLPVTSPVQVDAYEPPVSAPIRSGQGPALLIVEDDVNFASVIAEAAQAHGFSCVLCRSGKQAIELLQTERFVAVVLDILLPDISGWQIYRRMRGLEQHRDVPVHIISCVPQPQDWHDDGTHYLVKPIGRDDLEQVFQGLGIPGQTDRPLLLVEDVEAERAYYSEHLQQLGFTCTPAATAAQALELYARESFGAVVIDLNLPDQDGFDLLEAMHRERPLHDTRVVVNTGVDVSHQDLQRLRRYSAVVVRKSGNELGALDSAVQGFLSAMRSPPANTAPVLAGKRVLLVDDDVRNIYAMTALLDEIGLHVTPAKDGVEALECFAREPFDVILMDMAMPVMDGYTATRLLKEEHDCRIPVIALTAHAMKGDREKCITAGADDYLAKPVARQDLMELLQRWLSITPEPISRVKGEKQ